MSILAWLKRRRQRRLDDDDFQEELRSHFAIAEGEKMADGADREAAHYASLKEFGNVALVTEDARRVWTPPWMDVVRDFASDVQYAIRSLIKDPGFSLTVAGVLTVGIGVNASVFTMLKGIAVSPLAGVNGSERLVEMFATTSAGRTIRLSYPEYQYLRDHDRAVSGLFGSILANVGLGRGPASRSISAELVTGNYFQTLGVGARLGRTLLPSDEVAPGRHPVIVLSDGLWRRDFAADPDIVGTTIEINNYPLTVVGVSASTFHGSIVAYDIEAFIPVMMAAELGYNFGSQQPDSSMFTDRHAAMFRPQGLLQPGVSFAAAAAETEALWPALARERPLSDPAQGLSVVPFWRAPGSAQQYLLPILIVLAVTGLLVLMIACANIAGLVLVRGVSRRGEIAVRLALGATRGRITRLLIIESFVVALPGTILGIFAAVHGTRSLIAYVQMLVAPQPLYFNFDVDGLVIAFAAIVACLSALVFGFAPAIQSSRINLVEAINQLSRRTVRGRVRGGLVVAQVAVSLLLLIGAGLAARSFEAAWHAHPGFEPTHLSAVQIDVKQNGYDAAHGRAFYRRLLETARADAGIESATLATNIPMNLQETAASRVSIDGYEARLGEDLAFLTNTIASDYFRTLQIPLFTGREFQEWDDETGARVAIVNDTLAERFFDDAANAIGKRVRIADSDWRTVVGVVADVKYLRINEAPQPYIYVPFLQNYRPTMVLHTRGAAAGEALARQARANVVTLDPDLPIFVAGPMTDRVKGSLLFYNFAAFMLFIFGAAGMALATLGIYGLVSYAVTQSTREIGIRMAIGATTGSVLRRFLFRGVRLGAFGALIGILSAMAATRLLQTLLYGVSATDPVSFARGLGVVLAAIVMATLVPAWRAARTSPLDALRHE